MAYKGPKVHLHSFLTSKLDACERSDSRPAVLTWKQISNTHWVGHLMAPEPV
jgi:hypothetical protein